jgi:hypothetical protein
MRNVVILILILSGSVGQAQQIITDRPDQTESSATIPKGSFQIEAGVLLGFVELESQKEREITLPTVLLRYGLTKALELRLVNNFLSVKNKTLNEEVHGFSNLEIGAKVQILKKEGVNTEIAFLSHLVIPTSSERLINSNYGMVNKLSVAHELSENIGLGYNVGYNYFGVGRGIITYSLALGISLSDKVGLYFEPYGDLVELENHLASFDTGLTYLIDDNFQLDISFGAGINHTMNYMALGFSWNISNRKS